MRNGSRRGDDLKQRTKEFALRVIHLCSRLPRDPVCDVIGRQLLRCGTSIGAQYREACRARSTAEFVSKVESATQELDETQYWLELLVESDRVPAARLTDLRQEADELLAIFTASARTAKEKVLTKGSAK